MVFNPIVTCSNGKTFDPLSKPIDRKIDFTNDSKPYFNQKQISSECQFNTAYFVGAPNLETDNFIMDYREKIEIIGSWESAIFTGLSFLIVYFLVLELLRRSINYILWNKSFFK